MNEINNVAPSEKPITLDQFQTNIRLLVAKFQEGLFECIKLGVMSGHDGEVMMKIVEREMVTIGEGIQNAG